MGKKKRKKKSRAKPKVAKKDAPKITKREDDINKLRSSIESLEKEYQQGFEQGWKELLVAATEEERWRDVMLM